MPPGTPTNREWCVRVRGGLVALVSAVQIDTGIILVARYSDPAAAIRPTIVSIKGGTAATSEPNATSRISSVTGYEITSDLSIAERFAALKSDHIAGAPVRFTGSERDSSRGVGDALDASERNWRAAFAATRSARQAGYERQAVGRLSHLLSQPN